MRLTPERSAFAARQIEAFPLPETHPMMETLCDLFGEHTFFIDNDGLWIVEEDEVEALGDAEVGVVVKLANWADEGRTVLAPHQPEVTALVVALSQAA